MDQALERDKEDVRLMVIQLQSEQRLYERRLRRVKDALDALRRESGELLFQQMEANVASHP